MEATMEVTHDDNSLWPRLELLLKDSSNVMIFCTGGWQSKIYEPVQVGRDHLVFRSSLESNDLVVVPFHAITRLQVL
jgi:hypothetical protein